MQCDHPYCQKWRRIPTVNAENLKGDDPWYCSMNPNPALNFCDAKEEDHRKYDRMAKKVGVKFVMSELQIGSLVWAKMAGYCRFVMFTFNSFPDICRLLTYMMKGAQWLSGRVLDSRPRGSGFKPHRHHCAVVLEHDIFILA